MYMNTRRPLARLDRRIGLALLTCLIVGCGGDDDSAATTTMIDTTMIDTTVAPTTEPVVSVPATSEPSDTTTSGPATTTTDSTTDSTTAPPTTAPSTTAPTTAPDNTPTTAPTTTASPTASPTLESSFPPAMRATWRESDADSVSFDECRTDGDAVENFGRVLTISGDRFGYFETGGRIVEVHARSDRRLEATFDTTYADTPTSDRLTFELSDDGDVLRLEGAAAVATADTVRYVRCPDERPSLELEAFDRSRVSDAGIEALGCWLRPSEDVDLDPVFFLGADVAFMVIDGEEITLANTTAPDRDVFEAPSVDDTFSQNGYAATFVIVGAPRDTSIESSDRDVRLIVSTPDDRVASVDGVLGCGV